jgi:hypothetical protein
MALAGLFAATAPSQRPGVSQPGAEAASAIQTVSIGTEPAALRTQPDVGAERLEQRSSKARVLSILVVLAAVLGLLLVVRRGQYRHVGARSSSLSLRRHSVALRAPPSFQLA